MTIYFMPHASSLDNEAGFASGRYDVELSENGRREAESRRESLLDLGIELVYTSDLKRAYETAVIVFDNRVPIVKDPRLRECDYGDMTRKPRSEVFQARKSAITAPFPSG